MEEQLYEICKLVRSGIRPEKAFRRVGVRRSVVMEWIDLVKRGEGSADQVVFVKLLKEAVPIGYQYVFDNSPSEPITTVTKCPDGGTLATVDYEGWATANEEADLWEEWDRWVDTDRTPQSY